MITCYLQELHDRGCLPSFGDIFIAAAFSVAEHSIPYNQSVIWADGWRCDCSGHACRCMRTYKNGPGAHGGFSTSTLTTYGVIYPIPLSQAGIGDYLGTCGPNTASGEGGPTGHIAPIIGRTGSTFMVYDHGSGMGPTKRNAPSTAEWAKHAWRYVFSGYKPPQINDGSGKTWQQGDFGGPVRDLQGVIGAVQDGMFGAITHSMLVAWQKTHGLDADGLAGPKTQAELAKYIAPLSFNPCLDWTATEPSADPEPAPPPAPIPTPEPTPAPTTDGGLTSEDIVKLATDAAHDTALKVLSTDLANDIRTLLHTAFSEFASAIQALADSMTTQP